MFYIVLKGQAASVVLGTVLGAHHSSYGSLKPISLKSTVVLQWLSTIYGIYMVYTWHAMLCTCISNSSNIDYCFESLQNLKITKSSICISYTIHILGLCHVYTRYFCYEVLRENYAFLNWISGFNIDCSQPWHGFTGLEYKWIQENWISLSKYIHGIYHVTVYTGSWYIHGIYIVYTMMYIISTGSRWVTLQISNQFQVINWYMYDIYHAYTYMVYTRYIQARLYYIWNPVHLVYGSTRQSVLVHPCTYAPGDMAVRETSFWYVPVCTDIENS